MHKKFRAFTLMETAITLTIIGVMIVATVCATISSEPVQKERLKATSKALYTDIEYNFRNILFLETQNFDISKLEGVEEEGIEEDSNRLEALYEKYMEVYESPCSRLPKNETTSAYFPSDVGIKCASSHRGFNMFFYLNRKCSEKIKVSEYLQDEKNTREIDNACGYIAYATPRSAGILGEDFFVIGFGKKGMK